MAAISETRSRPAHAEARRGLIVPSTGAILAIDASRYDLSMGVMRPNHVGPVLYPKRPTGKEEARLRTRKIGISGGTYGATVRGLDTYQHYDWDPEQERFRLKPVADLFTPRFGYMSVGEVEESRKAGLSEGDRVAAKYGNVTGHTLGEQEFFVKLPDTISDEIGVNIAQFGAVCANAVAEIDVGEKGPRKDGDPFGKGVKDRHVLIMGGGPIGVWTAMFMDAYGAADVTVLDMSPERVKFLNEIGIKAVLNKGEETTDALIRQYRQKDPDNGPIPIDCTGNPSAPEQLFEIARPSSKIYAMSYYAGDRGVRLNQNFHRKRISVVDVQVQTQAPGYTRDELTQQTLELMHEPKYNRIANAIMTHDVPLTEAEIALMAAAYPNDREVVKRLDPYAIAEGPMMQVLMHPDAAVPDVIEETLRDGKVIEHKSGLLIASKEHLKEDAVVLEMADGYKARFQEGTMRVENEKGEVVFENATSSIELADGRTVSTADAKVTHIDDFVYLEVPGTKEQPDLHVSIRSDKERPGLLITQEIRNTTEKPIEVKRFIQLDMQEGLKGVATDQEAVSGIGYMSWGRPIHRQVRKLSIPKNNLYVPNVESIMDGGQVVPEAAHLQADNSDKKVLIGHVQSQGASRHQGIVELHNTNTRVIAWNDAENITLSPGGSRKSESVMVVFGVKRNEGLEMHAKEVAFRAGFVKEKHERPFVGVCTWSWAFGKLQPIDVRNMLGKTEAIEKGGVEIDLAQIDDLGAWRHPHGDWVGELNRFLKPEFGDLKGFTQAAHEQGEEAGVWMAPGFVSAHSELHQKIKEKDYSWYVKDANGKPRVEMHWWEGEYVPQYILDMTHPEVQEHMMNQFNALAEAGVDYIKLDFLYNLIAPGKRYKDNMTGVEAYHSFMSILKRSWGDRKVNACGAPFYKSAGLWGIRGGADVLADNAAQWYDPDNPGKQDGGAASVSVNANFMRMNVLRHMFQRIDPDSTVTRLDGDSHLTEAERQTIAASNRMGTDALITIGDNPTSLKDDQVALLKLATHVEGEEPPRPLRMEHGRPVIAIRDGANGRKELTFINWRDFEHADYVLSDEERAMLGVETGEVVFEDLLEGNTIMYPDGRVVVRGVAPHGVRVLATL